MKMKVFVPLFTIRDPPEVESAKLSIFVLIPTRQLNCQERDTTVINDVISLPFRGGVIPTLVEEYHTRVRSNSFTYVKRVLDREKLYLPLTTRKNEDLFLVVA